MFSQNKISLSKIFISLFFFGLLFAALPSVVKANSVTVTGYAWSSNIGWISFNCSNTSTCGTSNYKVNYDDVSGNLSGYAWSSNIGWIKFDGLSSYPSGGTGTVAKANTSTGVVEGWARACAGTQSGDCTSMTSRTDGWDGWVSLKGSSPSYGVTINYTSGDFSGYTWGSEVVGWISFNCSNTSTCGTSNYKVSIPSKSTEPCNYNIVQDNGETGVDCGGGGCPACAVSSSSSSSGGSSSSSVTTSSSSSSAVGPYSLTLNITGSGSGSVYNVNETDSTRGGETWYDYANGTKVKLQVTADSNSTFTGGWVTSSGGNCAGGALSTRDNTDDTCEFTMVEDKTTTVDFGLNSGVTTYNCVSNTCESVSGNDGKYSTLGGCNADCGGGGGGETLTLTVGCGTVEVKEGGVTSLTCNKTSPSCSRPYSSGTELTLTASNSELPSTFDSWSGDYSGTDNPLSIKMDGSKSVQAIFDPDTCGVVTISSSSSSSSSVTTSSSSSSRPSVIIHEI